jgi:hypothetical protein
MRYLVAITAALALATTARADDTEQERRAQETAQPESGVRLSDAQLDEVTGGALVNVIAFDVVDANVSAVVQANVLGRAEQSASSVATQRNPVAAAGVVQ